jgi:dienelactone hydrolase
MGIRISRRELALAAAGMATAAQGQRTNNQDAKKPMYGGALEGQESKVDLETFDPVRWTMQRHDAAPMKLAFRATNRKQAEAWQKELRAKVIELLGGFPQRGPLRAKTLEVREFPGSGGYKREKFVFESRPGVGALGYLLMPTSAKGPLGTIVCIPGHGRGVDDIVGIDEQGRDRTERKGYEYDFAIQVVERGMAAVAIEPFGFGCRRDQKTKDKGATAYACQPVAGSALLLGETMLGWRVYDTMRAIDWIETRPELNAKRVGCIGISGGGTCALFSAAVDTRIRGALVSGYLNTFRGCIMSMSHCIDNYVPGILNWAEMYDVAGLIAPRPLFSEGGDRDPIFPVETTRESFARVKKMYEVFGAPDAAQQEIFSGVHEFHGARGLPFLIDSLKA